MSKLGTFVDFNAFPITIVCNALIVPPSTLKCKWLLIQIITRTCSGLLSSEGTTHPNSRHIVPTLHDSNPSYYCARDGRSLQARERSAPSSIFSSGIAESGRTGPRTFGRPFLSLQVRSSIKIHPFFYYSALNRYVFRPPRHRITPEPRSKSILSLPSSIDRVHVICPHRYSRNKIGYR